MDYVYELDGDVLTIWAGEKGSPAYMRATFDESGDVLTGGWVYPGGGGYEHPGHGGWSGAVTGRALLAAGVLATPLFVTVAFTQAATRDGYELGSHMVSQLVTGDGGWLQMVNFLVAGTLFPTGRGRGAAGGTQQKWMSRLIGFFGAGVIAAGVFVADPAAGYPVGVPAGLSWHGCCVVWPPRCPVWRWWPPG